MKINIDKFKNLIKNNIFIENDFEILSVTIFLLITGMLFIKNSIPNESFIIQEAIYGNYFSYVWFLGYVLFFMGLIFFAVLCQRIYKKVKKISFESNINKVTIYRKTLLDFIIAVLCSVFVMILLFYFLDLCEFIYNYF